MFALTAFRFVLGLFVLSFQVRAGDPEGLPVPTYAEGELSRITCKPAQVKSFSAGMTIFLVEVSNNGALACEPMVFRCEWKDGKGKPAVADIARAPFPRAARVGRVVPVKGKESYTLQIATAEAKALKVSVVEALFSDAARIERAPVRLGRVERGHGQLDTARVASSSIQIDNDLPHIVDVVLRGRCTGPKDAMVLFTATIGPRGSGKLDLLAMPVALEWREPLQYYPGAEVAEIELVDWSARVGSTSEAARALFEPAYRSWIRHSEDTPAIEAQYRATRESVWDEKPGSARGSTSVSSSGSVATLPSVTEGNALVNGQVKELFASMRRPSFEELLEKHELELAAPGVVALHGPGFGRFLPGSGNLRMFIPGDAEGRRPVANVPTFRIGSDGRIVAFGSLFDPDATLLETRSIANGWVIAVERNPSGTNVLQYVHQVREDLVVPVSRRSVARDAAGKVLLDEFCRLETVALATDVPPAVAAPPSGPDADALRAHWDRLHRPGTKELQLSGRFAVESPGTDFVWMGLRKVEGRFVLGGFRGMLTDERVWKSAEMKIEGKHSVGTAACLGDAFLDRLGLWAGRDPASFAVFDEQFRGASVTRHPERELYQLDVGPIEEVLVVGDRIASLRFRAGFERLYAWKETPVGLVATRVETGAEVLEAKWGEVAKGLWLPTEFEFRKVFSSDWGPETIRITSVEAR